MTNPTVEIVRSCLERNGFHGKLRVGKKSFSFSNITRIDGFYKGLTCHQLCAAWVDNSKLLELLREALPDCHVKMTYPDYVRSLSINVRF